MFRHVRYHEADILEFERRGAQHLMTLLGIDCPEGRAQEVEARNFANTGGTGKKSQTNKSWGFA